MNLMICWTGKTMVDKAPDQKKAKKPDHDHGSKNKDSGKEPATLQLTSRIVIVIRGVPGSGKITLATQFAQSPMSM